jgi:hypothetical protein
MQVVIALAVLGCAGCACEDREAPSPTISDAERARRRAHGHDATTFDTATRALHLLLETRESLRTNDLDAAIRELSVVACSYSTAEELSLSRTTSITDMYPLSQLSRCRAIKCGGCFTYDGTYVYGPAFAALRTEIK